MMLRSEEYSHRAHSLNQTFVGDPLDGRWRRFVKICEPDV